MALSTISGTTGITDATITSAKLADFAAAVDLNGVELILDADQDTSITADTDDRIDFKIAGVEHFSFSNSSGDTIIKPMVDAKDIKFQQFDGRTLLDINDGGFVGIANGATGAGAIRIFEDTDNGSNYVGLTAGSISSSFTLTLPTADGSSGQFLKTDGSGALSFDTVSSAADDLTTGDAAVTIATSSGNITIDAQAGDADIIFKGTDGSSDITPMTLDMSDAGALLLTGGKIDLKNAGTRSKILFYCESSNAHAQTLQAAPHSESASNTLTLPSTGGNVDLVSTASTATLTNKTLTSPQITTSIIPSSADGATLGSASAEFSDLFLADAGTIQFGNDQEITLTHDADVGLKLKHTATADDKPIVLTLQTGETDMAANDVMGAIRFQAPDEGTGTDAILVAAAIQAVSEGDFSSSNNATRLEFHTGASEAASSKMTLRSAGLLTISDDLVIKDGGTIGVASDADSITIASNGAVTFSQTPVFPDGSLALADLDIDGGTDIGADLADADLFIVDDGAGGTNRKVAASRIKTYIGAENTPAFAGKKASGQSGISRATFTKVTGFTNSEIDTDTAFDGTTFTVPSGKGGKYYIFLQLYADYGSNAGSDGEYSIAAIYVNGSSVSNGLIELQGSANYIQTSVFAHVMIDLSAGDTVEAYVYLKDENGNTADVAGGVASQFGGYRLIGV